MNALKAIRSLRPLLASPTRRRWLAFTTATSPTSSSSSSTSLETIQAKFNELTGWSEIEDLKSQIRQAEKAHDRARTTLREAHTALEEAHAKRAACQRDVNELLQRKHAWEPSDVARFTQLYAEEHALAKQVEEKSSNYRHAQQDAEEAMGLLAESLRERYWNETSWSDRMRAVSTYTTVALMLLNLIIAVGAHGILEPRRRKEAEMRFKEFVAESESHLKKDLGVALESVDQVKGRIVDLDDARRKKEELDAAKGEAYVPIVLDLTPEQSYWAAIGTAAVVGLGSGTLLSWLFANAK